MAAPITMYSSTSKFSPLNNAGYPTYDQYRKSSHRQNFSIPESIVYYMIKNTTSLDLYNRLIKCCKYFFIKNPILVMDCLNFDGNNWTTCVQLSCLDDDYKIIDLKKILKAKIWITFILKIFSPDFNAATSLVPKLYNTNICDLQFYKQNITFNDLLFFSTRLEKLYLKECDVLDENGKQSSYEKIISVLPKVDFFYFDRRNSDYDFSNTAKELIKIPHFKNMKVFTLYSVKESFDIQLFYEFVKENMPKTFVCVSYVAGEKMSEDYTEKVQMIADEVLDQIEPRSNQPFYVEFDGQSRLDELYDLYMKYFQKRIL